MDMQSETSSPDMNHHDIQAAICVLIVNLMTIKELAIDVVNNPAEATIPGESIKAMAALNVMKLEKLCRKLTGKSAYFGSLDEVLKAF